MTKLTRRSFLQSASLLPLAGCALTGERKHVRGRLRHASVGVGGMGQSDLREIASHADVDIVALCDVDRGALEAASALFPAARLYTDYREMFLEQGGEFDSVNVTTPDHMHAPITLMALENDKHVYCQKPLTRTVDEARKVAALARRARTVNQMGIQNHSNQSYRQALAWFQAGLIGKIHEVHVWTDRPAGWWPQGVDRKPGSDPVPENLDWDLWLGVAPERPFKEGQYHPFSWRGWKDFGTGAQGDMACHLMDPALWFLGLTDPLRIRSTGPTPNDETYPLHSKIQYEFPANDWTTRGPLLLTWYDGGRKAPKQLLDDLGIEEIAANGCLFVGEEGALFADPYSTPALYPQEKFANVEVPEAVGENHWHNWVDACLGRVEPNADFEYSAKLSEVALLGNVALHFPYETLDWEGDSMRFTGRKEASELLYPSYRLF